MYDKKFAQIYDKDWAAFSETLAEAVKKRLSPHGRLLDLGCGTGNFIRALGGEFDEVEGVDISPHMIAIAKKNCPRATLTAGDVLSFDSGKKYDLIACNYDMINHLPGPDDCRALLAVAAKHLAEGGTFMFDFLTPREREYVGRDFTDDSGAYRKVFRDELESGGRVRIKIDVYERRGERIGGLEVVECLYSPEDMREMLARAGFRDITFCAADLFSPPAPSSARVHALCRK